MDDFDTVEVTEWVGVADWRLIVLALLVGAAVVVAFGAVFIDWEHHNAGL